MTGEGVHLIAHPELPGWSSRSPITAAMFNPALVSITIATAANQYEETAAFAMPWPLAYLVTPLVLHTPTREVLPRTKATSLTKWASDNTVIIAGFPARAMQMAPYVREGLRFGLREGAIEVVSGDGLRGHVATQRQIRKAVGDLPVIYRASGMIGRVFGRAGNAASIYAALRVQP